MLLIENRGKYIHNYVDYNKLKSISCNILKFLTQIFYVFYELKINTLWDIYELLH